MQEFMEAVERAERRHERERRRAPHGGGGRLVGAGRQQGVPTVFKAKLELLARYRDGGSEEYRVWLWLENRDKWMV